MSAEIGSFDPFNHGVASIRFTKAELPSFLQGVLSEGWDIKHPTDVQHMDGTAYYRMTSDGIPYFFKKNRPSYERQQVIDDVMVYCHNEGIPTLNIVPTRTNALSFFDKKTGNNYSLSLFVPSEHYDGSREELRDVAHIVARLHMVLARFPHTLKILESKPMLLRHDSEKLQAQLDQLQSSFSPSLDIPLQYQNIHEISNAVYQQLSGATNEETQIIHRDLHPYNVLFDPFTQIFLAIHDFEQAIVSQRMRDIVMALHRFTRTYGSLTERKKDSASSLLERADLFLNAYAAIQPTVALHVLIAMLQDEACSRISIVLEQLLQKSTEPLLAEFKKQVTLLGECELFSPLLR